MPQNQPIPYTAKQIEQAQTIGELQQEKNIKDLQEDLQQKIFYEKHKILRLLRKIFKFFSPHKRLAAAMEETKNLIEEATGVNIDIADNLADMSEQNKTTTEALKKTADNLEKISLVLTETSKQIESHGVDIAQMKGDKKDEVDFQHLLLDVFDKVEKVVQHDMETVARGNPNMTLYKHNVYKDEMYLATKNKSGEIDQIYKLKNESNGGYGFYPIPSSDVMAIDLTEMCKITNARGELLDNGIHDATKAIMVEQNSQLSKAADVIRDDAKTVERYKVHYDTTHKRYTVRDDKEMLSIVFDLSKPDEITANLYRNDKNGALAKIYKENAVVLKNAENGIEHTVLSSDDKNNAAKAFMASVIRMPETQSMFKQCGIENAVDMLIAKDKNTLTREEVQNTVEKYTSSIPKPLYIDAETFPDINLRRALQEQLGTDMIPDPREVTKLDLKGKGIRDLTGLDRIEGLITLDISNNRIEGDVNLNLPVLATLTATNNMITNLNINAPLAKNLDLSHNSLVAFNSNLPTLANLNLSNNKLTHIEFKSIPRVEILDFTNNEVKHIDNIGTYLHNLQQLKCGSNLIEGDIVVNAEKLTYLRLDDNNINSLAVKSDVQVLMIEADHNPMSEAYIPEANIVNLPQSCEVKPISDVPKEKLAAKGDVYVAVTSVSSNGEIEATTYHEDGTPAIGADKAAAVNANSTKIADTDFTRGEGVSKSAALEGSDSTETRTVVAEHKQTAEYRENSREEYKRDEREDNQRFKEEKQASKESEER